MQMNIEKTKKKKNYSTELWPYFQENNFDEGKNFNYIYFSSTLLRINDCHGEIINWKNLQNCFLI